MRCGGAGGGICTTELGAQCTAFGAGGCGYAVDPGNCGGAVIGGGGAAAAPMGEGCEYADGPGGGGGLEGAEYPCDD